MKKIKLLLVMIIAAMSMTSCDSNSPSSVAKQAMESVKSQNYDQLVDLMGDKQGDALNAEANKQLKAMFNGKADKGKTDKLESYKIISEQITDEGKKAVVTCEVKYEGKDAKEEKIELNKGADGVWRLSMGK